MRRYPTEAEEIMWTVLQDNNIGEHFRRQHIIDDYIADFVCIRLKLIIEIDGGYHFNNMQIVKDTERTFWLGQRGFEVLRFRNEEVVCYTDDVIKQIKQKIKSKQDLQNPTNSPSTPSP